MASARGRGAARLAGSQGKFSLYSEITVKGRQVTGYVKPLFSDLVVYDKRHDADKGGEIVVRLIQNAFFRAILPGFDEAIGRRRR